MKVKFGSMKKIGITIITTIIFLLPFCIKHELKGTTVKFHEQRGQWLAVINDEREKERPLYLVDDCKPSMFKPIEWDDFFVVSSVPEGYILYNLDLDGNYGQEEVAVSYIFSQLDDPLNVFGKVNKDTQFEFTQSKYEVHYIPIIQTENLEDIAENTYYYRQWKDENMIYWRYKDMLLCVHGKRTFDFLENMVNRVVKY